MELLDRYFATTRSPVVELGRHFFRALFQPEAANESFGTWLIQLLAVLVAASWLLPAQLFRRYVDLHALDSPQPFLESYASDTLWAIVLMTFFTAFVTVIEWQALFPDERDHLVLGTLPLSRLEIFGAKLGALALFFTLFVLAIALLPTVVFPAIGSGRWETRSTAVRIFALFVASAGNAFFSFLALLSTQGVLFLLLPMRWFRAVSFAIQVTLLLALLCAFPLLPYLPANGWAAGRAPWLDLLPPCWFWALQQQLLGAQDARIVELATRARLAFGITFVLAFATYIGSYLRYGREILEVRRSRWRPRFLPACARWLVRNEEGRGVSEFVLNTLARGRRQKMILFLVSGIGLALLLENFAYLGSGSAYRHGDVPQVVIESAAIGLPLTITFFLMVGLRRAFRIPADLNANWVFRFYGNPASAPRQMNAIFAIYVAAGGIVPLLICLPLEFLVFGWRALAVLCAQALLVLTLAEHLLRSWSAIPFTFEPDFGQRHLIHSMIVHGFELTLYSFLGSTWIRAALYNPKAMLAFLGVTIGICWLLHISRARTIAESTLSFTEARSELDVLRLETE